MRSAALLLFVAGCAEPYPAPEARIVEFVPEGTHTPCVALKGPLDAKIGTPVPVTGACSTDPGAASLAYSWSLADAPAGSMPIFGNPDSVTPTFIPDTAGKFALKLVVSNGVVASPPAFAQIAVGACGGRSPAAVLTASSDAPRVGDVVTFGATVTDDDTAADCAAHAADFDYAWSLTDVPPESGAALNAPSARAPSFTADAAGRYTVRLVVTDPTGRSGTATRNLTVAPGSTAAKETCGETPPVAVGRVLWPGPVAECGHGFIALDLNGGDRIELDGNASTEPDVRDCGTSGGLEFAWTLLLTPVSGGKSELESRDGGSTVLHVTSDGAYEVRLVARDSSGLSSQALVCSLYATNVGAQN
jgi:hypothetical protein